MKAQCCWSKAREGRSMLDTLLRRAKDFHQLRAISSRMRTTPDTHSSNSSNQASTAAFRSKAIRSRLVFRRSQPMVLFRTKVLVRLSGREELRRNCVFLCWKLPKSVFSQF
mmetsp:Transcript_4215/g.9332  ORF Transcript_4215/g.9332 Transcript_4215/m.9332 type:complete len:111 (+) Transcript_4215:650-982(+)